MSPFVYNRSVPPKPLTPNFFSFIDGTLVCSIAPLLAGPCGPLGLQFLVESISFLGTRHVVSVP